MSYLYAVQMTIYGYPFAPVKIGVSKNPDERAKVYTSGPFPTVWLGSWADADPYVSERQIHRKFADYRLAGEWFYPATSLVTFIERKTGMPIEAMQLREPGRLRAEFQSRFVALFPDGLSSIDKEWMKPGKAKPCSESRQLVVHQRIDQLDAATNPLRIALTAKDALADRCV